MNLCDIDMTEKTLLMKIQDLLRAQPDLNDVTFSVGPNKIKVRALKILLIGASPILKKEFEDKWEVAVVKDDPGIPLPEYDAEIFQLFVQLTSADTWSMEVLTKLNLQPNQLLTLLSICRRYEIRSAVRNLQTLASTFIQSFSTFKNTRDFLKFSHANLKEVLASDDLTMKEIDLFKCALSWAEFTCKDRKIEVTEENIRSVLGDCLHEIRFPIMSVIDFTNAMEMGNLLTADEKVAIYTFIGLEETKRLKYDTKKIAFKTQPRKNQPGLQGPKARGEPTSTGTVSVPLVTLQNKQTSPTVVPTDCLTLSLNSSRLWYVDVIDNTPFVCDASPKWHRIQTNKRIALHGFGFLGPMFEDSHYDVIIKINEYPADRCVCKIKKQIWAQKRNPFYIIFDRPVTLQPVDLTKSVNYYELSYSLKGSSTSQIQRQTGSESILNHGSTQFKLQWRSNQVSHIIFKAAANDLWYKLQELHKK